MGIHDNLLAERFQPLVAIDRFYLEALYTSHVLNFNMQTQTQTQWCWAATSTSVSKFYSWLSPWTQCKVASDAMNEQCCDSPVPSPCNQPWYLNLALDITENFVSYQGGTISWSSIKDELDKGLVVGARIGWSGGGGHFMVIHGVSRVLGVEYLHIDDPIYGKSTLTHQQFATNYQGSGTWTHTYFTKKKFYFMWYKDLIYSAKLLEPIYRARPLLDLHGHGGNLNKAIPDTAFSTPHYNFLLGLDQIKKDMKLPGKPNSLRVLETDEEKAIALYEVNTDADRPELLGVTHDRNMFDHMDAGLETLKRHEDGVKYTPELRSIRVPALNVEALWLHYDGKTEDRFLLIRTFDTPGFDSNKVFNESEFKALLASAADKARKMDDEMGA